MRSRRLIIPTALAVMVATAGVAGALIARPVPAPAVQSPEQRLDMQRQLQEVEAIRARYRAEYLASLEIYKGTKVGAAREGEEAPDGWALVAAEFNRLDPVPAERVERFRWTTDRNPSLILNGWYGRLVDVRETADGLLVQVRVSPRLENTDGGIPFTPDASIETYAFAGGAFHFLGAQDPPGGPNDMLMTD